MKNICIIRKYAAILALSIMGIVPVFAQGAVITYAAGGNWIGNPLAPQYPTYTTFPSAAQLQRLTHVIASDIGVETNKSTKAYTGLYISKLPNNWNTPQSAGVWNKNSKNNWLLDLVNRTHTEGVKAIICVGGGDTTSYEHWVNATSGDPAISSSNISKFVNDIAKFVTDHGLDGVDIDWEKIGNNSTHWAQCYNLLKALKGHNDMKCKRVSVALPYKYPGNYPLNSGSYVSAQIWNAVDAIHLMTYDEKYNATDNLFHTHSEVNGSTGHIRNWASWGASLSPAITEIKKLHLACASYGWDPYIDGTKVGYKDYTSSYPANKGDNLNDVKDKVEYCYGINSYSRVYGGVFIWELGFDKTDFTAASPNQPLLKEIWDRNTANGGYSTFISGPGEVCYDGSQFELCNPPPCTIYWTLSGSSTNFFTVISSGNPTTVKRIGTGTGNVWLQARTGSTAGPIISSKSISPCPPIIITGPPDLCYGSPAKNFTVANAPAGFTWGKSSNLNLTGTGTTVSVSAAGSGTGWVSINSGGNELIRQNVGVSYTAPVFSYIDGPDHVGLFDWGYGLYGVNVYWAYFTGGTVTSYSWSGCCLSPNYNCSYLISPTYSYAPSLVFYNVANVQFMVWGSNACGGDYGYKVVSTHFSRGGQSYFTVYPNPVSDILTIEIDADAAQNLLPVETNLTFDVRLYDGQGNLLRQRKTKGGTVEFNVTNLPDGFYYLHVYDGVNSVPVMLQILIEH